MLFIPTVTDFTNVINSLLPEPHASLLSGMVFGVRRTMPSQFYDALIATGVLHVIALSGQNIAIIINMIATMTIPLFGRKRASVLTIVCIVGFIYFVGAQPPIVRAGLMGSLSMISVVFGRQYTALLTLSVVSTCMILLSPDWLTSISFQLSFGATLGIILFGGRTKQTIPQRLTDDKGTIYSVKHARYSNPLWLLWQAIKSDLRLTLAAQVFTVPIILFHFQRISIISPIANLLVGWVVPMITVAGLIIAIAGWIFIPLAYPLAWMVWVPLSYFIVVIDLLAKLPFAALQF